MTDQMTEERTPPPSESRPQSRQSLVLPIVLPLGAMLAIGLVLFGFSRVLLSLTAHAATAVALVVTIAIMAVATIVASRRTAVEQHVVLDDRSRGGCGDVGRRRCDLGDRQRREDRGRAADHHARGAQGSRRDRVRADDAERRGGQAHRARVRQPGSGRPAQCRDLRRGPGQEPEGGRDLHGRAHDADPRQRRTRCRR